MGEIKAKRSNIYAIELLIWLIALLLPDQLGRPYKAGGEYAANAGALAHNFSQHALSMGEAIAVIIHGPPRRYVRTTQRCRNELDLDTRLPLDETIQQVLRWPGAA